MYIRRMSVIGKLDQPKEVELFSLLLHKVAVLEAKVAALSTSPQIAKSVDSTTGSNKKTKMTRAEILENARAVKKAKALAAMA